MMSDSQIGLLLLAVITLGGMIGGITAGTVVALLQCHRQIAVKLTTDEALTVPVTLRADPVTLRVITSRPEPVTVEVQPIIAEDRADIAARIIQETGGQIGPRPLARILNVSPSTAQAYIAKATGNLPAVSASVVVSGALTASPTASTTAPTTPPEEITPQ